ncbi:hypothetical protein [Pectinatus frisingensis]|uniref:hypothetical protein n=1 Tax=Pectinatus frisingensis TaxID=865 RepID=UPI001E5DDF22|nr:hypothetical protein [Pectinatus frisingensis]
MPSSRKWQPAEIKRAAAERGEKMSDYLVPCIASFTLGIGVTLIYVGLKFKETISPAGTDKTPASEVVGYDEKGADK